MTDIDPRLALARAHRNQFLDAAEDAIAENQRLAARLAEAERLLREATETARADTVESIRRFLA